jgi:hypothetical protein
MKKILFITVILLSVRMANGQTTFSNETDVITFMKDKTYINSDMGIELQYGYISEYNTYGITLKGIKSGSKIYYFNCTVKVYGSFADISGISVTDGSNFRIRLYRNRIVVGAGEEQQAIFYLKL